MAVGQLVIGDKLPTIRELEKQLGVNRHTIRRRYLNLAKRGLLQVRRGSGVTAAAGFPVVGLVPAVTCNKRKCLETKEHSDLVFYTTPCREFVEEVVPSNKKKQEMFFEFTTDALEMIRRTVRI